MYKDQFQSLEDILENALKDNQIKYFAYALSRARGLRDPTPRLINLAVELIYTKGIKWVQVLQRLAIENYQLVFQICKDQLVVYPSLINLAHPINNQPNLAYLQDKVFELLQNNTENSQILWCSFVELVIRCIQQANEQSMVNLLNRINTTLTGNNHFLDTIHQFNQNVGKQNIQTIYSVTGYKVILCVSRLYKSCSKMFRRKMNYLLAKSSFETILLWMRSQFQMILANGMGVIIQNGTSQTTIKQELMLCLLQIQSFVEIEDLSMLGVQKIIRILFSHGLISNMSNLDAQERLNWQYGLICNQYGDDLPSHIARVTVQLSRSLPSFLRVYVSQLSNMNLGEGQIMMRYIIVHKQLIQRCDLVYSILQPFLERVINNLKSYTQDQGSQLQFCRKVRLLMFYSQILKQKYFGKMVQCVLDMIKRQSHTSFCFIEGYNLMKQIISKSNSSIDEKNVSRTSKLIKQQAPNIISTMVFIVSNVYQQYPLHLHSEQRQGKLFKLFQLFQELISKNQGIIQKILPQILKRFCYWTIDDISASWRRGVKSSGVINFLIRITKTCIMLIRQEYYIAFQQSIYDLLDLLKNHNIKDYYQDLLEILVFVINQDMEITPRICFVIVQLQRIVQYNKSMYCIINVIKALCNKSIANSVLFNWSDLCLFLFNLFTNYFNTVEQSYSHHYSSEWAEILTTFGSCLQVYSSYLQDNNQVTNSILYCLQRLGQNQIKLQLFLIMNHLKLGQNYQFYRFSDLPKLELRNTFRLICLYYCDKLRENYNEGLLNEFINFYKIFEQKRHRKAFKQQVHNSWQCLSTSSQVYISQTLRILKKNRSIDSMQLNYFRKQLALSS